ncbi:MAG TPA: tryptophan synthase subunit alpha [Acidimicrobiales bacterium]|nr:tryptophan synthase subunit alpha [Acidimicrobiales bacterium]
MGGVAVEAALRAGRDAGRKLLVPYVTGGLGGHWLDVLQAMVSAGADAVEIGIPFSDPVMDGPTIQEASARALQLGATPVSILTELRQVSVEVPLIAMTYYNIVFRAGHRRFAQSLVDAGLRGALIPDVPLEELGDWWPAAEDAEVETVLLAAPITPDDRMAELCRRSRGFVYGVNLMGVTGERASVAESAAVLAKRLKAMTDKPVLMGFGVSTPDQAVEAASIADGVIVASALMRTLIDGGSAEQVGDQVAALRAALDAG